MKLSNPRFSASFDNWPLGGSKRGNCTFEVRHTMGKGFRVARKTTGTEKYTVYGGRTVIVDGDDGRTYILQEASGFDFIKVLRSDFKSFASVFPNHPDYSELKSLIETPWNGSGTITVGSNG